LEPLPFQFIGIGVERCDRKEISRFFKGWWEVPSESMSLRLFFISLLIRPKRSMIAKSSLTRDQRNREQFSDWVRIAQKIEPKTAFHGRVPSRTPSGVRQQLGEG
jgi:hypothetical protein